MLECLPEYFGNIQTSTCDACPEGCVTCDTLDKCNSCEVGYMKNYLGRCDKCEDRCEECAEGMCLKCKSEELFIDSTGVCVKNCGIGNYGDPFTKTCQTCATDTGCLTCDNYETCTRCDIGYQLVDGLCEPCEATCLECANDQCLKCKGKLIKD